jgi:hypothetical protein
MTDIPQGVISGAETAATAGTKNWPDRETCGATDWAPCDDGRSHVYGVCELPQGHSPREHLETRGDRVWANWSGDCGPVDRQLCEHTAKEPDL